MTHYPEGTPVLVRYPAPGMTHETPREEWPWMPGVIEDACGADEWFVVVTAREVATEEDGQPAQDGTPEEDLYFPCAFRSAEELRAVAE